MKIRIGLLLNYPPPPRLRSLCVVKQLFVIGALDEGYDDVRVEKKELN